ncbi:MAG TPA: hypothetical protein VFO38_06090 [Candidatus Saccharimonadales bacterium]|nr:hypothetical protein [Candidatus Saccharimonadales bacterium]
MNLIPDWIRFYGGLVIAIASALHGAFCVVQAVRSLGRSRYEWLERLFWVTISLYGLGTGLKFAQVGPEWVRWHMGDIGFPLFAAVIFSRGVAARFSWDRSMPKLERAERAVQYGGVWRRGALIGFVVSVGYEVLAGAIIFKLKQENPDSKEELGVGGFDWWDIAHYGLGALIGWTLWNMWLNRAKLWLRAEQEGAVAAETEAKTVRKEAKKERPKRLKPGQRKRRTR